jgi:hypothetical protein
MQPDTAQMKLFVEIACRQCDPVTVVEVFAGVASADFRSMPLAQKTGTEFAEAVVSDDQERSNFLALTPSREGVAALERADRDTTKAKRYLRIFEKALAIHVADRDRLSKRLADAG